MKRIPSNFPNSILRLYELGYRQVDIANLLGMKRPSVHYFFQQQGIRSKPFIKYPNYFSCIDTPNKAWLVGFIAADGYLVDNGSGSIVLGMTLSARDRVVLEFVKKEVGSDHKIMDIQRDLTPEGYKIHDQVRLHFAHPQVSADLLSLGITQRKSLTLGRVIDQIPEALRAPFIIGYFDGDGSVHKVSLNGKQVQIRGTRAFLEGVRDYLGFGTVKDHKTSVLTFAKRWQIKRFYGLYDHCDFYLKRKHRKFDKCRTISSPFSNIKPEDREPDANGVLHVKYRHKPPSL